MRFNAASAIPPSERVREAISWVPHEHVSDVYVDDTLVGDLTSTQGWAATAHAVISMGTPAPRAARPSGGVFGTVASLELLKSVGRGVFGSHTATTVEKEVDKDRVRVSELSVLQVHKKKVTCIIDGDESDLPRRNWTLIAAFPGKRADELKAAMH